ncbi:MAG: asparagine synthase (glutamine-hydrolyzing), partial [Rubrivivax sp.]|nr:asparagine synthase (glutamine-hydrolyzing) [Rubrivivax sp.]
MCGITGFVQRPARFAAPQLHDIVEDMSQFLAHRGPDDSGRWCDAEQGVALGHRRLSIIDLSLNGHQPMASHSQHLVIVFNGEIYNHLALREQLGARPWRGNSDTETLLAAIEHWGVEGALQRCSGMFAFALWDRLRQELVLARDRIGEKPLYYGWQCGSFMFASELHALRRYPGFDAGVDPAALAGLLGRGVVPAPLSIHPGIRKLMPGTLLRLARGDTTGTLPSAVPYWSLARHAAVGISHPFQGSDDEAVAELESRLGGAVRAQMIGDVPIGAFLSGGIDSSLVVALMQRAASQPVKTFTVGFDAAGFDESAHARAVAHHLGTDHTELHLSDADIRHALPAVIEAFDEPFGDSSAIPTYLVARLARTQVTVSLSG